MNRKMLLPIASFFALASCHSINKISAVNASAEAPTAMVAFATNAAENNQQNISLETPKGNASNGFIQNELEQKNEIVENKTAAEAKDEVVNTPEVAQPEKVEITSFEQVKNLAKNGAVKLNNHQLKRLDKLDKKYNGDFNNFKKDIGSNLSSTQKVVAAVGIIGLLMWILNIGGFLGAFVFLLAAGAFLLKWAGVIEF